MGDVALTHTIDPPQVTTTEVQENFEDLRDGFNARLNTGDLTLANGAVSAAAKLADGVVSEDKLAAALAAVLGLNAGSNVGRGKSIIATEETRNNTAYGTLTTPDTVAGVVLPTDGLIFVAFQALVKSSVLGAGRAALFLDSNQLKTRSGNAAPQIQEATTTAAAGDYGPLATASYGLIAGLGSSTSTSDVTTGQSIGAPVAGGVTAIFAAADTYDVSVQFKATSGTVTAKERKLWVWTMAF